ncbi:MAG: hypothetical protein LBR58_08440 [Propionibacteriaceae bacterium]|nr:hypothetical protein [Propionibacteriaceae bacterium]
MCSPLTCSFAQEVYRLIFARLAERLGADAVPEVAAAVAHMAEAHEGRMYYRVDNWYRLLQLLPGRRWLIPIWKRSLAVQVQELPPPLAVPFAARLRVVWRLLRAWFATPGLMSALEADFAAAKRDFDASFPADSEGLRELYFRIRAGVLRNWDITLVNDLRAFVATDIARRLGRPIGGVELAAMAPVRALADLARTLAPCERAALAAGVLPERANVFIAEFGDRGPAELKLESATFRTHPDTLIPALLGAAPVPAPPSSRPGRARQAVAFREASRLNRARLFGMVRSIVRLLGEQLAATGQLAQAEDVFYLTLPELGLADGPAGGALAPTVAQRKAEWARYTAEPASPPMDDELAGTACSAGVVEAEVVVVLDPAAAPDVAGKIVVAQATDPGWVFLLSRAAGVIAERGSLLSHVAIIARELGLPAVVGVPNATRLLRGGDRVRIDGAAGTVERV